MAILKRPHSKKPPPSRSNCFYEGVQPPLMTMTQKGPNNNNNNKIIVLIGNFLIEYLKIIIIGPLVSWSPAVKIFRFFLQPE